MDDKARNSTSSAPAPTWPRAAPELAPAGAPAPPARAPDVTRAPLRMLDIFSGSGSASRAAQVRGWHVVRIDNAEGTACDLRADVTKLQPLRDLAECEGCGNFHLKTRCWDKLRPCCPDCDHALPRFDLVWASPPCTAFSTANQSTRDVEAGMKCVHAAIRVIRELAPRWWVLENVHGATRAIGSLLGPPVAQHGSFYLWGVFPPFEARVERNKTKLSGRRRAERRAAIPWTISDGLVRACEALARELAATAE